MKNYVYNSEFLCKFALRNDSIVYKWATELKRVL